MPLRRSSRSCPRSRRSSRALEAASVTWSTTSGMRRRISSRRRRREALWFRWYCAFVGPGMGLDWGFARRDRRTAMEADRIIPSSHFAMLEMVPRGSWQRAKKLGVLVSKKSGSKTTWNSGITLEERGRWGASFEEDPPCISR